MCLFSNLFIEQARVSELWHTCVGQSTALRSQFCPPRGLGAGAPLALQAGRLADDSEPSLAAG